MYRAALLLSATSLLLQIVTVHALAASEPVIVDNPDVNHRLMTRSLVNMGDTARLERVMARAAKGEKIVIGAIGGSITQGALASTPDKNYASLVAEWWRQRFPRAQVRLVNAGIGATGSYIGCHRLYAHLLKEKPDFVVAEYSVNDPNTELSGETLEGIIRRTLNQPNKPAVMLLFMSRPDGSSAQEWHSKVGQHYNLPMVSFRDAFVPEYKSGQIESTDFQSDGLHPSDRGHKACATLIAALLDKVYADISQVRKLPRIAPMPKPLISDTFEHATMLYADSVSPLASKGWAPSDAPGFGKCWETSAPGSYIEFEVVGTDIGVMYYRERDMGMVAVQVDDRTPIDIDANFVATFGYYCYDVLARGLKPGRHRVTVRLLNRKAADSSGHRFQLAAIMVAGRITVADGPVGVISRQNAP